MPVSAPLALLIVIIAGVALATQAPINAALGRSLGSPIAAAAVSFAVGLVVLIGLTLVLSGPQPFAKVATTPGWQLVGGLLGAFYVSAVLWGVSTLGVLSTMAALILGQMGAALLLDGNGLFGLPVQALTPQRIAAAVLVAAGLLLSRV
jgi:bacterial/archaeal transporter family-2 protein